MTWYPPPMDDPAADAIAAIQEPSRPQPLPGSRRTGDRSWRIDLSPAEVLQAYQAADAPVPTGSTVTAEGDTVVIRAPFSATAVLFDNVPTGSAYSLVPGPTLRIQAGSATLPAGDYFVACGVDTVDLNTGDPALTVMAAFEQGGQHWLFSLTRPDSDGDGGTGTGTDTDAGGSTGTADGSDTSTGGSDTSGADSSSGTDGSTGTGGGSDTGGDSDTGTGGNGDPSSAEPSGSGTAPPRYVAALTRYDPSDPASFGTLASGAPCTPSVLDDVVTAAFQQDGADVTVIASRTTSATGLMFKIIPPPPKLDPSLQISCVSKLSTGPMDQRITGVGGSKDGKPWRLPTDQLLARIQAGDKFYVQPDPDNPAVFVQVATGTSGHDYPLAKDDRTNLLIGLPKCRAVKDPLPGP